MIYDTPKVAIFGALTCYVHSDLSLYTCVDVAFLYGRIFESNQDRDELLTIVVIRLLNRFVHGRVPKAVLLSLPYDFRFNT